MLALRSTRSSSSQVQAVPTRAKRIATNTRPRNSSARSASKPSSVKVLAFQPSSSTPGGSGSSGKDTAQGVAPSRAALLASLLPSSSSSSSGAAQRTNVYGKPLSKSELSALDAAVEHWSGQLSVPTDRRALRQQLLAYLQDAATNKTASLSVVEGSMALLEQLHLQEAPAGAKVAKADVAPSGPVLQGAWTPDEMLQRWRLVIGADVGGIQYIPVTEELTVEPPAFVLDADLNLVYAGFSGDAAWLAPGHLRYTTRRVRLELRLPEEWERALKFLGWRAEQASKGVAHYNEREQPPLGTPAQQGKDNSKKEEQPCRSDPTKPGVTIPLPFPANELFCFASNGKVAPVRSSLGGLILLLNKSV